MEIHETEDYVQEQADDTLNAYVEQEFRTAFVLLQKKIRGEGCCCPNCVKAPVSEVNNWVSFICPKHLDSSQWLFHLDKDGRIQRGDNCCKDESDEMSVF